MEPIEMITDILPEAVIDTLKLLPFLYLTYLFMEWIEDKAGEKSAMLLRKFRTAGPLIGSAAGAIPQCGFSAAAASLFSGKVITLGTLIAIFLSTSDEMLPLLISRQAEVSVIAKLILSKFLIGVVTGFAIDLVYRAIQKRRAIRLLGGKKGDGPTAYFIAENYSIHELCEDEHCGCEEEHSNIFLAALKHTLKIALFIFVITFLAAILVESFGEERVAAFLAGNEIGGIFVTALIGLIPNCGASVLLTTLFLDGLITTGQAMAGLLVSAGVGLLVLFRTNRRHLKNNIGVLVLLYVCGALWGLLINALVPGTL